MADLDGETILDAQARRTSSVEQKFELVAAGHGIALVPRSVAESYARTDLVIRSVKDAEPAETCLVVTRGQRERRVRDYVAVALETIVERPVRLTAVE